MSALRPAFFILYLESFISRLNVIPCHDLTLSVSEPDNAAAKQGQELRSGQPVIIIYEQWPFTYFCVLTIRKQLSETCFERNGIGQEPSRGHKFSILENVVLHRDFTSATLASFDVILLGRACPKPCRVTIKFIIVPWTEYNTSFDDTLLLFLQKSNYLW